jgi:hypothetical protein
MNTKVTEMDILLLSVPDSQEMTTTFGEYRKIIRAKDEAIRNAVATETKLRNLEEKLQGLNLALDMIQRKQKAVKSYTSNM